MTNKLKSYRLPEDIITGLATTSKQVKLDETELVRRALRYYLRQIEKDRSVLVSQEASDDLVPAPL